MKTLKKKKRETASAGGPRAPTPAPPKTARGSLSAARWATIAWLPFLLLFLHRQEGVAAASGGLANAASVLAAAAAFGTAAFFFEARQADHTFVFVSAALMGLLWGSAFSVFGDIPFARLTAMLWYGICCGQMRFHWAVRRLSSKRAHHVVRQAFNLAKRKVGVCVFFVVGECVGSAICVGWTMLPFSVYGYVLVVVLPIATYHLSTLISRLIISVFGNKNHKDDRSRMQLLYWVSTIALSVTLLFASVGYFMVNMVPYVWSQQLLMAPYGVLFELVSFHSRRQKRVAPYRETTLQHEGLINDIFNRRGEFRA
jgi:hypothetical protein